MEILKSLHDIRTRGFATKSIPLKLIISPVQI